MSLYIYIYDWGTRGKVKEAKEQRAKNALLSSRPEATLQVRGSVSRASRILAELRTFRCSTFFQDSGAYYTGRVRFSVEWCSSVRSRGLGRVARGRSGGRLSFREVPAKRCRPQGVRTRQSDHSKQEVLLVIKKRQPRSTPVARTVTHTHARNARSQVQDTEVETE